MASSLSYPIARSRCGCGFKDLLHLALCLPYRKYSKTTCVRLDEPEFVDLGSDLENPVIDVDGLKSYHPGEPQPSSQISSTCETTLALAKSSPQAAIRSSSKTMQTKRRMATDVSSLVEMPSCAKKHWPVKKSRRKERREDLQIADLALSDPAARRWHRGGGPCMSKEHVDEIVGVVYLYRVPQRISRNPMKHVNLVRSLFEERPLLPFIASGRISAGLKLRIEALSQAL